MASPQLLNPMAPMAYLVPHLAYQTTIASYITVGTTGGLIWDIFIHADCDYKLLYKSNLSFATVIYFLSRESVLMLAILETVFQTAQLPDCEIVQRTISGLYTAASCLTALLVYSQVRQFYNRGRHIAFAFLLLWLGVLGGGIAAIEGVAPATFIGPTSYCQHGILQDFAIAALVTHALLHTSLFLIMVCRKPSMSLPPLEDGSDIATRILRTPKHDSHIWYLVAIMCNWSIVICHFVLHYIPAYWWAFIVFNLAVTNIMVCHLCRENVLGGSLNSSSSGTPFGSIRFAPNPNLTERSSAVPVSYQPEKTPMNDKSSEELRRAKNIASV